MINKLGILNYLALFCIFISYSIAFLLFIRSKFDKKSPLSYNVLKI